MIEIKRDAIHSFTYKFYAILLYMNDVAEKVVYLLVA